MNGVGTIFYKNGKVKYQGIFVDDKIEKGEYYSEDGNYYSGTFKNWMKHGNGIIYNKHNIKLYEGTFANNKYDGDGEELLDDGTTYLGEFRNGKKEGHGLITDKNGEIIFEGKFSNNYPKYENSISNSEINPQIKENNDDNKIIRLDHEIIEQQKIIEKNIKDNRDNGLVKDIDLDKYIIKEDYGNIKGNRQAFKYEKEKEKIFGKVQTLEENKEFINEYYNNANGKKQGEDKIVYLNGNYYIGKLNGEKRDGKGTLFDINGDIIYEGEYKNDKRNGKGIYYEKNKIIYEGDFINNKAEGKGKLFFENGDYYIGEFKNDIINGNGKLYRINDKVTLEGNFLNGKLEGKGKKIFEDKGYYEGEFKEGIYNGKGKIVDKNNETKYEGDFVKGRYEGIGTLIYDDGSS